MQILALRSALCYPCPMKTINLIYCLLLVGFVSTGLLAQSPTEVAGASDRLVEPFQIVGNIYFVGPEAAHSSFLITSPEGHILINSGFERQVPTIRESIEKLGFVNVPCGKSNLLFEDRSRLMIKFQRK